MSQQVEQRIVEMRFDNKEFEKNAQVTMNTLDEFEKKLSFKGAGEGLEALNSSAKHFSLHPLTEAADTVEIKFSAMSIAAIAAIQRIVDKAMDAGEKLVKSLSTDQITAGWDKYAQKTSSVQTIMAATAKQYDDADQQMEDVNNQLEKLNWFTDETSYSFLDMVNNIGKFTSNNIGLEESVTAMQGISTWAAISGANVQEAGRAMYNLSQAMGTGSVKLIDWKSIENANMATAEFKETAIESAVALGRLKKVGDGLYETFDGNEVSVTNFNSALKDGWFDRDVLMGTLDQYGSFSEKLHEVGEETGLTATQLLQAVDQFQSGEKEFGDILDDTDVSAERLNELLTELSDDTYDLGRRAFKAAQEAKTFREAIDSVKDAVSTGWMNTFELIFGDYNQAKKLWTNVANELYDVFAEAGNARNEMLAEWAELGGRDLLFEAISVGWERVRAVIDTVRDAFQDIFPPMTGQRLYELTQKFRDLFDEFEYSKSATKGLNNILKSLLRPLKTVKNLVSKGAGAFKKASKWIFELSDSFFSLFENGNPLPDMLKKIFGGERYERGAKALETIGTNLQAAWDKLKEAITKLLPKSEDARINLDKLTDKFSGFSETIKNKVIEGLEALAKVDISQGMEKVIEWVGRVYEYIRTHSLTDAISETIEKLRDGTIFQKIIDGITELYGNVKKFLFGDEEAGEETFLSKIVDGVKVALEQFGPLFDTIKQKITDFVRDLTPAKVLLIALGGSLLALIWSMTNALSSFSTATSNIGTFFATITKKIIPKSTPIRDLAIAIGVLAASMVLLSKTDPEGLERAKSALILISGILAAFGAGGYFGGKALSAEILSSMSGIGKMISGIAFGMLALVLALKVLEKVNLENIGSKLLALFGVLTEFVGGVIVITKLSGDKKVSFWSLIGIAASLYIAVSALKKISKLDPEAVRDSLSPLLAIVGSLSLISIAAKGLKFGSAMGMIVMAFLIIKMVDVLRKLSDTPLEDILKALPQLIMICGMMVGLAAILRLAGTSAGSAGFGILALIFGIALLTPAIEKLGDMDLASLAKGVGAVSIMLVIMGKISQLLITAMRFSFGSTIGLVTFALAIDILIPAFKALGEMAFIDLAQSVGAIGAMLWIMGKVSEMCQIRFGNKAGTGNLIAMVGIIGVLGIILGLLGELQKEGVDVLAAGEAMALVLGSIAGVFAAISGLAKFHVDDKAVKKLAISFGEVALLVVAIIGGLGFIAQKIDWVAASFDKGIEILNKIKDGGALITLGTFLGAMAVFATMSAVQDIFKGKLDNLGKNTLKWALIFDGVSALILGLVGFLGKITGTNVEESIFARGIAILKKFDDEVFTALGNFLLATIAFAGTEAVAKVVGLGGASSFQTIKWAVIFDVVVALIAGLVGALGAINEALGGKGMEWLTTGADMLGKVGEAIGKFVGGIVGGFGEELINDLTKASDNLTKMSAALKELNADDVKGSLGVLAEFRDIAQDLKLAGGHSRDDLVTTFTTFGDGIGALGSALRTYNDASKDLDANAMTQAADVVKKLVTIHNSILTDTGDMSGFADNIAALGDGLAVYSERINTIDDFSKFDDARRSLVGLVSIQNSIDKDAIGGWLFGGANGTLSMFAANVKNLGDGLKAYFREINKIDFGDTSHNAGAMAAASIRELVDIQDTLGAKNSFQGWLFGGNRETLSSFGTNISALGSGLAQYYESIKSISFINHNGRNIQNIVDPFEAAAEAFRTLSDIQNSLEPTMNGGFLGKIFGGKESGLDEFGNNLKKLGSSLYQYWAYVNEIEWNDVSVSLNYLKDIGNTINDIAGLDTDAAANNLSNATTAVASTGWNAVITEFENSRTNVVDTVKRWFGLIPETMEQGLPDVQTAADGITDATVSSIEGGSTDQANAASGMVGVIASTINDNLPLIGATGVDGYQVYINGLLSDPNALKSTGTELTTTVRDAAGSVSLYGTGQNAGQGFVDGLRSKLRAAKEAATSVASAAKQALKDFLGIKSPSKEFEKLGEFTVMGFNLGLLENIRSVKESGGVLGNTLVGEVFGMMSDLTDSDIGLEINPVVRPVLDLSSMQGSVGYVNGMVATLGQMDFVWQANLAMQMPNNYNQNAAILNAVNGLNARIGAIDESILRLQATVNGGLVDSVAAGVRDGLNGTAVMADKTRIGAVVTDYQRTMARRGV